MDARMSCRENVVTAAVAFAITAGMVLFASVAEYAQKPESRYPIEDDVEFVPLHGRIGDHLAEPEPMTGSESLTSGGGIQCVLVVEPTMKATAGSFCPPGRIAVEAP